MIHFKHAFIPFSLLLLATASLPVAAEEVSDKKTEIAPSAAVVMPSKAAKEAPTPMTSGAFLSGRFAGISGDSKSAADYLEEALAASPGNHKLAGQLLVLYLNRGEMKKAVEKARQLEEVEDHELIVDLVLAADAVRQSHYAKAQHYLKRLSAAGSGSVWMPLISAWVKNGQGHLKAAVTVKDILPEGDKAPAFLAYHLALLNDVAGFTKVAEQQYDLTTADHSKIPFRAVEAAANFYKRYNKTDKLEQLRLDYLNAHPNTSALVDIDSTAELFSLMNGTSASAHERLIANPQQGIAEVLFTMASVLFAVEEQQDTQIYLRLALHLRNDFPLAQLLLGNLLEADGQYKQAADVYGSINPQSPLSERALLRKAFMIERQGRLTEAIAMLDERAEESPQDHDALIAKGDLLRARSRFPEAVEAYSDALERIKKLEERNWGIFFARGACYERLGKWKEAEADLRRAVKLNPEQPEVLNYLGYGLLTHNGSKTEAKELIEKAYELQPSAPHIIDSMGWVRYQFGDIDGAVEFLEQAIEMMPGDATVNDHLGDAYWQSGRKTEARYQWKRALTFSPEPELKTAIERKLEEGIAPLADVIKPQEGSKAEAKEPINSTASVEPGSLAPAQGEGSGSMKPKAN